MLLELEKPFAWATATIHRGNLLRQIGQVLGLDAGRTYNTDAEKAFQEAVEFLEAESVPMRRGEGLENLGRFYASLAEELPPESEYRNWNKDRARNALRRALVNYEQVGAVFHYEKTFAALIVLDK